MRLPALEPYEVKVEKQWISDIKASIEIVTSFLQGQKSIFAFLLDSQVHELEIDVKKHTGLSLDQNVNIDIISHKDKLIRDLYRWYDEEYRPQVITNDIVKPILERPNDLKIGTRLKLATLCNVSLKIFGELPSQDIKEMQFEFKLVEDILNFSKHFLEEIHKNTENIQ